MLEGDHEALSCASVRLTSSVNVVEYVKRPKSFVFVTCPDNVGTCLFVIPTGCCAGNDVGVC